MDVLFIDEWLKKQKEGYITWGNYTIVYPSILNMPAINFSIDEKIVQLINKKQNGSTGSR